MFFLYLCSMKLQEIQSIFSYLDIKKFAKENSIDYPHLTRVLKGEVNLTERMAEKIKLGLLELSQKILVATF